MTPFSDIYDLFLVQIRDFKLDNLYALSITDFETFLQGFLLLSIAEFDNCSQDLSYDIISATPNFPVNLILKEKTILAKWMVIIWLEKEINDVTAFNLHLNDTDFRHFSEAQNLKEKSERRDRMREIVNQDMTNYGLKVVDWDSWSQGDYSGS